MYTVQSLTEEACIEQSLVSAIFHNSFALYYFIYRPSSVNVNSLVVVLMCAFVCFYFNRVGAIIIPPHRGCTPRIVLLFAVLSLPLHLYCYPLRCVLLFWFAMLLIYLLLLFVFLRRLKICYYWLQAFCVADIKHHML